MDKKNPSSAEVYPKAYIVTSPGYSSSVSTFPIRAPLTLDSDTESCLSSKGHKFDYSVSNGSGYGSDISGFESEGGLSGEDEFETASERPFVADPDDDSAKSSDFVRKHVGFRPFVNDLFEENNEFNVSRDRVSGTSARAIEGDKCGDFGADPDEGSIENDGLVDDTHDFKPFLSDPYGEIDENEDCTAYVSSTSGERTSVKSIEGDRHGDFGAGSDSGLIGNDDFVNDLHGENNRYGVFGACVSATSGEGTSFKSFEDNKYGYFGFDPPDDNLNDNSEFDNDFDVIRSFFNDTFGKINKNEVSRAYVADTDKEENTSVEPIRGGIYGDFGESSVIDIGILTTQKLIIPTAKLSRDSDEESLVFEDVKDDEFSGSVKIPDTHSLEKNESAVRINVSAIDYLEEEENDGSELELEIGEELLEKIEMNRDVETRESEVSEIVASDADFTCSFVDETKGTISTKLIEEIGDFVTGYDDKNDSTDGIKDPKLVEIDSADSVKKDNLTAEMEDGQPRSYDVFDPLLISTLDLEFSEELKDKVSYGKGNSERSFSMDHYSNGSVIDDIEQTLSPNALEENSKDIWLKTEVTREESEGKKVINPNTFRFSLSQNFSEEQRKNIEKLQLIRVKFFRLVQRLDLSIEDSIASQVLYRLNLIERGPLNQLFTFVSAMTTTMELECENGNADSTFSLNVLVIGKTGVGKSATINSIFGEEKVSVSAFEPATTDVKEIIGTIDGLKVRIFDTPGLRPSPKEKSFNIKVLSSTKRLMRKCPPDIVLYVDRLDTEKRDFDDLPLLKSITRCLGSSLWQKAIITLTHAASTPPDGPNGSPLSYDLYVAQRLRTIQVMISQSLGRNMLNSSSVCSVSLVENHPSSQEGGNGEKMLLNGEKWRPRLLLLCSSMKLLSEANLVAKDQDLFSNQKVFGVKAGSLPLPHLLSSFLHVDTHSKTPYQWALSASDQEDQDDYDQLPPFKLLTKTFEKNKDFLNGLDQNLVNLSVAGLSLGRSSKMVFRAGLNDELKGQVSIKINGSEQLQIAFLSIFSIVNAIVRNYC